MMLTRVLARILALVRRLWRAMVTPIIPVVVTAVIVPAVRMPVPVRVGRSDILRRRLPHDRGLHVWLAGSGHGAVRVAAPVVAIGVNLRGHKDGAVVLLLWRAGWNNRSNNIASLWVTVLGCEAPVVKIFALPLACAVHSIAPLPA